MHESAAKAFENTMSVPKVVLILNRFASSYMMSMPWLIEEGAVRKLLYLPARMIRGLIQRQPVFALRI